VYTRSSLRSAEPYQGQHKHDINSDGHEYCWWRCICRGYGIRRRHYILWVWRSGNNQHSQRRRKYFRCCYHFVDFGP
jgi:hypothetical protein